jgi:hypothetical protein
MKRPLQIASWALAALFALLLQPKITFFGFPINLTIALVYVFAAKTLATLPSGLSFTDVTAETKAAAFGAAVGLIEDMMSGVIPGLNLVSKGLLGMLSVVIFRDFISQWTPAIGAAVIFSLTMLDGIIVVTSSQFVMDIDISEYAALQMMFVQAIINLPLGFIFRCGHKISDFKGL